MNSGQWPPGFRFHPTDEELVLFYLKRRILGRRLEPAMIADVDVYKWEPFELPEKSLLKSRDKQWYFFSPRDKKYPNGSRSSRTTRLGYWKATGKDRTISHNAKAAGNKKTLVYYQGRAPKGDRTDWVMYEYTLDEQVLRSCNNVQGSYALYRVFRKSGPGPKNGEEYGAPFREEDWDDQLDNCFSNQGNVEESVSRDLHGATSASAVVNVGDHLPIGDLEELLMGLSDEQDAFGQYSESSTYLPMPTNIAPEVESQSLAHSLQGSIDELNDTLSRPSVSELSFQTVYQSPSLTKHVENPDAALFTYSSMDNLPQADEEFLEIKDFVDMDSIVWDDCTDMSNQVGNADGSYQVGNANGSYDPSDYFDASTFFAESGLETLDIAALDPYLPNSGYNGMASESYHDMSNPWMHNQGFNTSASIASEANQFMMPSSSSGSLINPDDGGYSQELINNAKGASASWFSSAMSTFLDSVPSSPALASENALISRAFKRLPSFKGRQNVEAVAGNSATSGMRSYYNGRLIFFSLVIGASAVGWTLGNGSVTEVVKGLWERLTSS